MIQKDGVTKKLPCNIEVDGREITVSTVAQAEVYGWAAAANTEPELSDAEFNIDQDLLREQTFKLETDKLYLQETEHALVDNRAPDYTEWLAKKEEIRARFPYRGVQ